MSTETCRQCTTTGEGRMIDLKNTWCKATKGLNNV